MNELVPLELCSHRRRVKLVDPEDSLPPYIACDDCGSGALYIDRGNWVPLGNIQSLRIAFSKIGLEPGESTYADVALGGGAEEWVTIR